MRPGAWERREKERHLERVATRATFGRRTLEKAANAAADELRPRAVVDWASPTVRQLHKAATFAAIYGSDGSVMCIDEVASFDFADLERKVVSTLKKMRAGK